MNAVEIFLTQINKEKLYKIGKHVRLCKCCYFDGAIWLHAEAGDGMVHGLGYGGAELCGALNAPTPKEICHFALSDTLNHGCTAILTADEDEFVRLIGEFFQAKR